MTTYKYPIEVDKVGLYLQFIAYDYQSAPKVGTASDIQSSISSQATVSTTDINQAAITGLLNTETSSSSAPSTATEKGRVFLYLPPKLEFSYGAEWQKVQFGALGNAFGSGSILGALKGATDIGLATGANVLTDQVMGALKEVPKLEGVDLDNILGAAFGVTFNDNTIQTFEKMQLRDFSYDYLMVARNQKEESMIKQIIKFFKVAMHPDSGSNDKNNTLFLKYPYVFRIVPSSYKNTVSTKQNGSVTQSTNTADISGFVPSTKYCALTKFDVSYTPDSVLSMTPGGFVTAVRISMSFSELVALTRNDINGFEDSTDIGGFGDSKESTNNGKTSYPQVKRQYPFYDRSQNPAAWRRPWKLNTPGFNNR
jgi:hypothetical protein